MPARLRKLEAAIAAVSCKNGIDERTTLACQAALTDARYYAGLADRLRTEHCARALRAMRRALAQLAAARHFQRHRWTQAQTRRGVR